ncbi:MAG TPA: SRPBCC family protein [Candidatus Paceibacterota bacterium]
MKVIIFIIGVIVALLVVAYFLPRETTIQEEIMINKPEAQVWNYVKYIKNQENYSVWVMADPNRKLEYIGTDGTVGFIAKWDSEMKSVGKGEQEIKDIIPNKRMDVEIRFEKPFKGTSQASTEVATGAEKRTKVVTTFKSTAKYPMNLMSFFMQKALKGQMQETLTNLKNVLEK